MNVICSMLVHCELNLPYMLYCLEILVMVGNVGVYFLMRVLPFFELHWAASVVFMSKHSPFVESVCQAAGHAIAVAVTASQDSMFLIIQ